MKDLRLHFLKGDILAIAAVVVLAVGLLIFFVPKGDTAGGAVQVYQDGKLLRKFPLNTDESFEINGDYHNTLEIRNGKVAITHSDCPGGDCLSSGWIGTAGRSIVCLPNRVEIRIVGKSDVDFVVG